MKRTKLVVLTALLLTGCALEPAPSDPAGDLGGMDSATPLNAPETLAASGGRLVREKTVGLDLARASLPFSEPVIRVFGQSRRTGEGLVLVASEGGTLLKRVAPDGSAVQAVGGPGVLSAGWSPDGTRFFAISSEGDLLLFEETGTRTLAFGVRGAAFAPDGVRLALVRTERDSPGNREQDLRAESRMFSRTGISGLTVLDLQTGQETMLSRRVNTARWTLGDGPSWSPDGHRILFQGGEDGEFLWMAVPETGETRPLEVKGSAPLPASPLFWSPDGNRVYYGAEVLDDAPSTWVLEFVAHGVVQARRVEEGFPRYRVYTEAVLVLEGELGHVALDLATDTTRFLTERQDSSWSPSAAPSSAYDVTYYWPLNTTSFTNVTSYMSHSNSSGGCYDGGSRYDCSCNGSSCRAGHRGTDLGANLGTSILAGEAGTVIGVYGGCGSTTSCSTTNSSCNGGAGNYVVIQHNSGAITKYMHMKSTAATYGATVQAKAVIGYVGSTGSSTGCHLHFQIEYGGAAYDPYFGTCSCTSSTLWKSSSTPPPPPPPPAYADLLWGTVASNADGRLEVFAIGNDRALLHSWQTQPNGSWSGWFSLGGVWGTPPAVGTNADGRLSVLVMDTGTTLYTISQTSTGGWSPWSILGTGVTGTPAVGRNKDGRLEVFVAQNSTRALMHAWQLTPNGGWSGFASLGGTVYNRPAVASNLDGRLEVFTQNGSNGLYHIWQLAPNGGTGWSGFALLGANHRGSPAVARNLDGRLEAFAVSTDGAAWHAWQTSPGGVFSSWASLGGSFKSSLEVATNIDGRLEVFGLGSDGAAYQIWQNFTATGVTWSPPVSMGGSLTSSVVGGRNQDGRLEIFALGTNASILHNFQWSSGGYWSGWVGGVGTGSIRVF